MTPAEREALNAFETTARAFRLCFNTPAGRLVLVYFGQYCRAGETCIATEGRRGPIDINRTMILEGRREVFLEIQRHLNITPEGLYELANWPLKLGEDTDE